MASDISSTSLSIYPVDNNKNVNEEIKNKMTTQDGKSFGNTAMMLFSDLKAKYNNVVTAYQDFKIYAKSTEGKVKFGLMGVGLATGVVLSYRTTSKRLWYKRLLPLGTLSLAASACYPYKAWSVAKSVSHGAVVTYNVSKVVASYSYEKLKKLSEANENPKQVSTEIKEKEYIVDEKGIPIVKIAKEESPTDTPVVSAPSTDKTISDLKQKDAEKSLLPKIEGGISSEKSLLAKDTSKESETKKTDIYSVIAAPKELEKSLDRLKITGDPGQSSPEDDDLYTTR